MEAMATTSAEREKLRRKAARIAVDASRKTDDTLPRRLYELACVPAPEHATEELQSH